MKTLIFNGEEYHAEKIVKTQNDIIGYTADSEVFTFRGVSNFSLFELEEGQEWDVDEKSKLEQELTDLWDVVLFGGAE